MKTKISLVILSIFLTAAVFAQGKASVYAANTDISDNLDLRAVASIFGESRDLSDFEYKLNDPNIQISNLDLNNDNQVDYLRVVEMVQNSAHVIVLQSVLQEDTYQDVATIVISKIKNKKTSIQIIGDPYMYGANYIYEPIYVVRPPLFSNFWITNYRPYHSYYRWNRYPTFFTFWSPYTYNQYHQNVYVHINHNNYYNYSSTIYNSSASDYYRKYRSNGYEQKYPHRDFKHRTSQVNRYDYDRIQSKRNPKASTGLRPSAAYPSESRKATQHKQQTSVRPLPSTAARVTASSRQISNVKPSTNRTSTAPRSMISAQRSTTVNSQNTKQRSSTISTRNTQHNSGLRNTSPSGKIR